MVCFFFLFQQSIRFNEKLTSTFEYPSESSLCDDIGLNGDSFDDDDSDLLYSNGHFLGSSPIGMYCRFFTHNQRFFENFGENFIFCLTLTNSGLNMKTQPFTSYDFFYAHLWHPIVRSFCFDRLNFGSHKMYTFLIFCTSTICWHLNHHLVHLSRSLFIARSEFHRVFLLFRVNVCSNFAKTWNKQQQHKISNLFVSFFFIRTKKRARQQRWRLCNAHKINSWLFTFFSSFFQSLLVTSLIAFNDFFLLRLHWSRRDFSRRNLIFIVLSKNRKCFIFFFFNIKFHFKTNLSSESLIPFNNIFSFVNQSFLGRYVVRVLERRNYSAKISGYENENFLRCIWSKSLSSANQQLISI